MSFKSECKVFADGEREKIVEATKELLKAVDGWGPGIGVIKEVVDEAWDEVVQDAYDAMDEVWDESSCL